MSLSACAFVNPFIKHFAFFNFFISIACSVDCKLGVDISLPSFENSVDPDQLASDNRIHTVFQPHDVSFLVNNLIAPEDRLE